MKKHGFRSIFSLLLALMMVCSMLPTAAFAEGDVEEQSVVVERTPAEEPKQDEDPPAPEDPKTFTVTYTDGADGAVFPNKVYRDLSFGTATPTFDGTPEREGYTFTRWDPAVAETVTADVTYTALWQEVQQEAQSDDQPDVQPEADGNWATVREQVVLGRSELTVPQIPEPDIDLTALNTGHRIDVRFTVLYVGSEFNIGYNYGTSESTTFVCQYKTNHSDTAYNNHTIAISDIKAAAGRASVNSGYQIVGWSKESNANPTTWSLNKSGTTACNKGTTIYLVAKNPNPTTKYTYTLNYDANGGTGAPNADSWSTTDASVRYHSFTVTSTVPTLAGYTFKGWKAKDGSDTIYTGGTLCSVSRQGNDVVQNGNTWTRTLYAVWEKNAPNGPASGKVAELLGQVKVHCTTPIAGHEDQTYDLYYALSSMVMAPDGSGYTCDVRVVADDYVTKYNRNYPGTDHVLADGENRIRSFVLRNDNDGKGWYISEGKDLLPIVFNVKCEAPTPPSVPTDREIERALSGKVNVVVSCVTANSGHPSERYPLFAYVSGLTKPNPNEVTANSDGTYSYTVSFLASNFVKMYSGAAPFGIGSDHELADAQDLRTVTLTLRDSTVGWTATTQDIKVSAKCEEQQPEETYTVTYTDGVEDEEVFKDEVYPNLKADDPTPKFNNGVDPTRDGFTFQGWEPEVTQNVTGNATYTAKWEEESTQPGGPSKKKVIEIYGNVTINCTTLHGSKPYPLTEDTIEIGSVTYREDIKGYTCMVYISSAPYVEKFDTEHGGVKHTVDFAKKGFEFNYLNGQWFAPSNDDGTIPIVFNVKCEEQQPQPYKPSDDEVKKLLGDDAVNVICTNEASGHGGKPYGLLGGTFEVRYDGQYGCEVIVTPAEYVRQFDIDREVGQGTHASDASKTNQSIINLKWVEGKWTAVDAPAKFYVLCVNEPPIEIPNPEVEKLLKVDVICTTSNNAHVDGNAPYALIDGTYSTSAINNEGDVPTCTVTVSAEEYVKLFNSNIEKEHTLIDEDSKTITLRYVGNEWKAENDGYVDFKVKCKTQPEVPGDITDADLAKLKVVIHCTTNGSHTDRTYDLIAGTYRTDYSNDGGFTCYIAVLADLYVKKYVSDTGTNHELVDPQKSSKTITLRWNTQTKAWAADSNSVTFDVKCKTEEKPAYPNVSQLLGACVKIHCTNDAAKHEDKTYGLANFGVTQIERDAASGRYYFNVLLKATLTTEEGIPSYLDMYNKDIGKTHTLAPNEKVDRSIRVEYVDNKWVVASQVPVQYNVVCVSDPVVTYTVTYLDGANGRAFASQVYPGLLSGTATPKFNGTPVRSGYVFIGWSPVWSGTVTGNVTYTATWSTITGGLDKVPKTGDNGLTLALSALLLFSFCGAAACVVSTKKRG